ncbi:hypothetical protein P3342_005281 [Pyrenophora teres f. teres]|nr:hypothetical protein P3342_005281 [Pyrenophora teres f. teres]
MGPNSRGVANLTPEQLARKRANDREAQRAIRERTKNQIDRLNQRIRDLESQQPYNDLQVVLREKEAVLAENADIKKRLESVLSIIQPIVRATAGLNGMLTADNNNNNNNNNDDDPDDDSSKAQMLTVCRTGCCRRTVAPSRSSSPPATRRACATATYRLTSVPCRLTRLASKRPAFTPGARRS